MTSKPDRSPDGQTLHGLYAITDSELTHDSQLANAVQSAIEGGASIIQYRDKRPPSAQRTKQAASIQAVCCALGVPLIINDDIGLCRQIGASGVHLGNNDSDLETAREQLGVKALIGISCYNRLDLALIAQQKGADYVAFGSFYSSSIKPDAVHADTQLLHRARGCISIPIVAIGGITRSNASSLVDAGADMVAVISDLFGASDIRAAATEFARLFNSR